MAILQWLQQEGYWLGEGAIPPAVGVIAELSSGRTPDPESWHQPASEQLALADYQTTWSGLDPSARQAMVDRWGSPAPIQPSMATASRYQRSATATSA